MFKLGERKPVFESERDGEKMNLEEILQERLTNDKTAEAIESNYKGLLKVEGIKRDRDQEMYIKLAMLERRDTPQKPKAEAYFYGENYFCPSCGSLLYSSMPNFCDRCGQRLKNE